MKKLQPTERHPHEGRLERLAQDASKRIGSPASLLLHTIFFVGIFSLEWIGIPFERILLVLTTLVSLEAIYLAIFIQMTVNRQAEQIEGVSEDVEDISEDVEEISKDIDTIQEDVKEISEDVEDIQEDVEEIGEELEKDEKEDAAERDEDERRIDRVEKTLEELLREIRGMKK